MGKYDDFLSDDDHQDIASRVDKITSENKQRSVPDKDVVDELDRISDMDEKNPLEQAMKFNRIKRNPPRRGYMRVDAEVITRSRDRDGKIREYRQSPYFVIDLNTAIMANIAACPSNIIPMLIDQAQRLAVDKMKTFKPEKRTNEFNWWWIVLAVLLIPGILTVVFMMFKGG